MRRQRSTCSERRLEDHPGALPPGEQRLHVPAAAVELGQHREDDVVARDARREVERQVRPEAVRVREQRALRPPGRAGRVDEQEAVLVRRLPRDGAGGGEILETGAAVVQGVRRLGVLLVVQKHGRRRICELVGELRLGEPPVERARARALPWRRRRRRRRARGSCPVSVATRSPACEPGRDQARPRAARSGSSSSA